MKEIAKCSVRTRRVNRQKTTESDCLSHNSQWCLVNVNATAARFHAQRFPSTYRRYTYECTSYLYENIRTRVYTF